MPTIGRDGLAACLLVAAVVASCGSRGGGAAGGPQAAGPTGGSAANDATPATAGKAGGTERAASAADRLFDSVPERWTAVEDGRPVPVHPKVRDVTGDHGGTATFATAGDLGSVHPLKPEGATAQNIRSLVWDSLTTYDNARWEQIPNLARGWESTPDGLVWTFHLREGVKWSDGEEFDADDVIFTFEQLFHPDFVASTKNSFEDSQKRLPKVEKVDRLTVRFILQEIDAIFVAHVGFAPIMPQHVFQADADAKRFSEVGKDKTPEALKRLVGTGAFRLTDHKTEEVIVFERNPLHWRYGVDGKRLPYLDRIVFFVVPSQDTQFLKFLSGDFDVLEPLRPEDYEKARQHEATKGFTVFPLGPSLDTNYLCFNQNPGKSPDGKPYVEPWKLDYFRRSEFRRAVSHGIDRQKIVDLLLEGRGRPGYDYTPEGNRTWHKPDTPKFPFDKTRARTLLDAMGLVDRDGDGVRETPDGHPFQFEIVTNTENDTRKKVANMIKSDLRDLGLDALNREMSFKTLVPLLQSQFAWEAVILGWASGVPPDPLSGKNILLSQGELHMWYPQQKSPSTPWEAEVDRVMGEVSRTVDLPARVGLFRRVLDILGEQQPMIFTFNANLYVGARNRFRNLKPTLLRPHTYWNHYELAIAR
ncbi:MAG: ABC transporter substrate-binding protein [Planctomycetales bacterium]|nr:ABC transporter substrate-binding protein [Planctomycetales bacterium]